MVTDENDNPVSGATVIVQGTTTGTTTTAGKFTIQVTPASILEVKFLGYKTAEVKVGTQTNLIRFLTEVLHHPLHRRRRQRHQVHGVNAQPLR